MFSGPVSSAQVAAAMRAQTTPSRPAAFGAGAQQTPFRGVQMGAQQVPFMGAGGGLAALMGQPSMMPPPQPAMGGGQVSTQQPIVTNGAGPVSTQQPIATNGGGLQALSQPAPPPSTASASGGSGYDLSTRDGRMAWMRNHDNMTPEQLRGGGQQQQPSTTQPQFTQVGGYNVPGANPPQQVVQPGMPGQLDMIARQLGMGGYGDPAALRQHMDQFYKPMSMPNYGATPIPQPSQNMQGPNPKATTPWENSPWAQAQAAARGQQPGRQMPGAGGWFDRWNAGRK